MSKQEISIPTLALKITSEAAAYEYLEGLRWNGETVCPHCGEIGTAYFLKPANGTSRRTRTGSISERRVWKCKGCRKQFSVLTGTIFHGTKIPVRVWLFVVFEMCASKNGVSAREIERKYDLTPKTAWFMVHRIREAMKREPLAGLLSGTVASDETWIGGTPANRPKHKRPVRKMWDVNRTEKPVVQALVHAETGEVRTQVIANVKGDTLREMIAANVDMPNSTLVTDEAKGYKKFADEFAGHETVVHAHDEYVNEGGYSTNAVEGYFSQLKRSIDGTHHHVSVEHLPRYLAEYDYRYTTRGMDDSARMVDVIGNTVGRRLTYRPLTGD
ncbi:MAG: IS1595 family transposase [Actinomycetota bacterium]|nr:IS1595 family transposase [Actinomycetota bacterium]